MVESSRRLEQAAVGSLLCNSPTRNGQSVNPKPQTSPLSLSDPLIPWLTSIRLALDDFRRNPEECGDILRILLENCISNFSDDERYRNDARFLKMCILYADVIQDFKRIFDMMEEKGICLGQSMLYEAYAAFLIAKDDLLLLNILRNTQPLERLKEMYAMFLKDVEEIVQNAASEHQIYDKSMKMEAELVAADAIKEELIQIRGDIQKLNASRHDLSTQVQILTQDLSRSSAELQRAPAIKAEIEAMKQEVQHAWAAIDYGRKGMLRIMSKVRGWRKI